MGRRQLAAVFAVLTLVLVACGQKESSPDSTLDKRYEGWDTHTYQNIKILHPPNHPQKANLSDLSRIFIAAIANDCRFFNIAVPTDTLVVIYYTGPGQGRALSGHQYGFNQGDTIHFWPASILGVPIVAYLLPKWQPGEPKFFFLKQGLMTLFDNSGRSNHRMTLEFVDTKTFKPLDELARDTLVMADIASNTSIEAASFADFFVYYYGMDSFRKLYTSSVEFDMAVSEILGISVDSLQTAWLNVVRQVTTNKP